MALVDATDSIMVLRAYGWAFVKPICKLYYNMPITFVSVVIALVIGSIEVLGVIGDKLALEGDISSVIAELNASFGFLDSVIRRRFRGELDDFHPRLSNERLGSHRGRDDLLVRRIGAGLAAVSTLLITVM
jgi:hypothetical protein